MLTDLLGKSSLLQWVQKLNLFVIGRFRFVLCFSVFQGSLLMIVIMTDGSEKRNRQLAFELHNSHVCEKRSKAEVMKGWKIDFMPVFRTKHSSTQLREKGARVRNIP